MAHDKLERRTGDYRLLDHEARLLKIESHLENLLWHHRNDQLLERLRELETSKELKEVRIDSIEQVLQELHELEKEKDKRAVQQFDERAELLAGRLTIRAVLWALGTAGTVATTALLTYLGLKGGK